MRLLVAILLFVSGVEFASARDECKDVLINKVMNLTEVKRTREISLAMLAKMSTLDTDQQNVETSAKFPIEGIPVEGQGDWARSQRNEMQKSLDLDLTVRESGSLLMLSGQETIVAAWRDCMLQGGGGLGTYFEPVADGATQVLFHIEYLQDSLKKGREQLPVTLAGDVYLDPSVKAFSGADCLTNGFILKPGDQCTVQLIVPSAWTIVPIVMTFRTAQGTRVPLDDVLLPRVAPSVDTSNVSFNLADLYSNGGANANTPVCADAPAGHTFVEPVRILTRARGAAVGNNSCQSAASLNVTRDRICVTSSLVNTPGVADYYCGWTVEATAARVVMVPPKPTN